MAWENGTDWRKYNMNEGDMHKYDDIIELPRHVSVRHPQRPVADRAAQFSPFAALTGYEETVKEAARRTEEKIILTPDEEEFINETLLLMQEGMAQGRRISVSVTYFMADTKKEGGSYRRVMGVLRKIDQVHRKIILEDGSQLSMENIIDLQQDFNF